jgi:hypothetical protein
LTAESPPSIAPGTKTDKRQKFNEMKDSYSAHTSIQRMLTSSVIQTHLNMSIQCYCHSKIMLC